MRFVLFLAMLSLAACASEKLGQAPPAGVDFSGRWSLNAADSDDPQRLVQAQSDAPPAASQSGAPQGGPGGRGGRAGGMTNFGAASGAFMPSVSALGDGLRWPGKQLEIKQVAGVVAFSSDGYNRICEPQTGSLHRHHAADRRGGSGHDTPRARDAPPPRCGWLDKTLIVQGGDPDDDHAPFEEQYSLSEDGRRLVEVVSFKGGRSSGFTMSRVWDRAP